MTGMCCAGRAKRLVAISPSLQPTTIRQSAAFDQVVRDARIASEQTHIERVRAGDATFAGHRVRDRD
jgi:hypothetical protein